MGAGGGDTSGHGDESDGRAGRRAVAERGCCPECGEPAPARLWLAVPRVDDCTCGRCGTTWTEDDHRVRRGPVASAGTPPAW